MVPMAFTCLKFNRFFKKHTFVKRPINVYYYYLFFTGD